MRVLHLSPWQQRCGIARYTEELVHWLGRIGVDSHVHPLNARMRKYLTLEEIRGDLAAFADEARNHDLVHVQHEYSFFNDISCRMQTSIENFAFLLKRLRAAGKPVLVTFHSEPDPALTIGDVFFAEKGVRAHLRRYLAARSWRRKVAPFFHGGDCSFGALVLSRVTRVSLAHSGFVDSCIDVVPHGCAPRDESKVRLEGRLAKERLGYPADCILLSQFGFITPYKGHEVALDALKRLPGHYHLALVGGPHPEARGDATLDRVLAAARRSRELAGRVRVTGYAEPDLVDLYHAATDFCVAPYYDIKFAGSGAITWALSSGKPIIASRIPAFTEINEQAECMVTFTAGTPLELAWRIERLASDPALQRKLAGNAGEYVRRNSWSVCAEATLAVYRSLLREKGRPRRALAWSRAA
jgi:glycosyltransferase involved in cell wall biosynthesis